MIKTVYFVLILFLAAGIATAKPKAMREVYNLGGYIDAGTTDPYRFAPHPNPRPLPRLKLKPSHRELTKELNSYLEKFTGSTALLLIEDDKILFEAYRRSASASSEFYSMSIGKSMTSLALGQLFCRGGIDTLDVKAQEILPQLGRNNFGRSSIKQLLTMSSGAYVPINSGQPAYKNGVGLNPLSGNPFKGQNWPLRLGQVTINDLLWGPLWFDTMHKSPNKPGEIFSYKSGDTLTLSKIIEKSSGLSTAGYFDRHIWQQILAEQEGHWEADKTRSTMASAGFQISLRDWGRLALWISKRREQRDCFGNYLKEATSPQIILPDGKNTLFKSYGYQWWTENRLAPGFWGMGYAGQIVGIDPKSKKILIKFSHRTEKGDILELMKIFRKWTRP